MDNGNFRESLFGGFNRSDVSEYIVKLARERNEYKERAEAAELLLTQYGISVDGENSDSDDEDDDVNCSEAADDQLPDDNGADCVCSEPSMSPACNSAEDLSRVLGLLEGSRYQLDMAISSLGKIKTDLR